MRFGANVFDFEGPQEWAQRHVEQGLGAAYWPLPVDALPALEAEYVDAARECGLVIAEVGIWNNLLDPDEQKREANIAYAIGRLAQAERVGARCCVNTAGSYSAVNWYGAHADNDSQEAFDRIVATTQRIIDEVRPTHTHYALEPMPWMHPYDAESMQRLLDAVEREAFGVHVDMVNLINSPDKVYRTGEITRDFFRRFTGKICSVHAKDVRLTDELTVHIEEALPGEGVFDFDTLLKECHALGDVPVMSEHLSTAAEYRRAVEFMRGRARALGLAFDSAEKKQS